MALTTTRRRAGLVLALAAILAPLGIGTAYADAPSPMIDQPAAPVQRGVPTTITATCGDPSATGLRWHTSDEAGVYRIATPSSVGVEGASFAVPVTFQNGGWFQAECQYGDVYSDYGLIYLTVNGTATTTALSAQAPTVPGGPITGTATVSSADGVPSGEVRLYLNGTFWDSAAVLNGVASFELLNWTVSPATVQAEFVSDTWAYADSWSNQVPLTLPQEQTPIRPTVTVQAPATAYVNAGFEVSATVVGGPDDPTPTGSVQFRYSEGATLGSAPLVNGTASLLIGLPFTGVVDVYAVYSGDEHFTDRSSARQNVTLKPVPVPVVTVQAAKKGTTAAGITATVTVAAPDSALPTPDGGVQLIVYRPGNYPDSVTNGTLVNGTVTLTTDKLPVGEYRLLAHYSGGPGFPYAQTDSVEQDLAISLPAPDRGPVTPGKPSTPVIVPTPTPAPAPVVADPAVSIDRTLARPGTAVTLTAEGFVPGEVVRFVLHSDPVFLGTAVADANGVATLTVDLPAEVPAGQHRVIATGVDSGRTAEVPVLVADPRSVTAETTLATTGADPDSMAALISLLLVSGAGLLLVARLRRRRA